MSEEEDYYKILGLDRNADKAAIKARYRQLALKWHPDKNMDNKAVAEKKFKQIGEAFEVLSDDNKRAHYDRYGKNGLGSGGRQHRPSSQGHMHDPFEAFYQFREPMDIFREVFGGDPFGSLFADHPIQFMNLNNRRTNSRAAPYPRSNFMSFSGFPDFQPFGLHAMQTMQSMSQGPMRSGGSFKSYSSSSTVVNGKVHTVTTVRENGKETTTEEIDGVVTNIVKKDLEKGGQQRLTHR